MRVSPLAIGRLRDARRQRRENSGEHARSERERRGGFALVAVARRRQKDRFPVWLEVRPTRRTQGSCSIPCPGSRRRDPLRDASFGAEAHILRRQPVASARERSVCDICVGKTSTGLAASLHSTLRT